MVAHAERSTNEQALATWDGTLLTIMDNDGALGIVAEGEGWQVLEERGATVDVLSEHPTVAAAIDALLERAQPLADRAPVLDGEVFPLAIIGPPGELWSVVKLAADRWEIRELEVPDGDQARLFGPYPAFADALQDFATTL